MPYLPPTIVGLQVFGFQNSNLSLLDGVVSEDFQHHERGARDQDQYLKYKENVASHQSHVSLICHTMNS